MIKRSVSTVGIYVLLLIVPMIAIYLSVRDKPRPPRPKEGHPLPEVMITWKVERQVVSLASALSVVGGKCVYLTVVSPECSVCARMRATWVEKHRSWQRQFRVVATPVWLSTSSLSDGEQFVRGFAASSLALLALHDKSSRGFADLGVRGTPTSFLLTADGRLRQTVLGDVFPLDSVARFHCSA
jgi:hypothetical protein